VQIDVQLQQRFGERVRKLRLAKGYSQEAFALQCELDRTYVSGIERGVRNPTLQVLLILARGLDTTISNMTRGADE
jgi:transcriptional regulator with XRE-family HTH domain